MPVGAALIVKSLFTLDLIKLVTKELSIIASLIVAVVPTFKIGVYVVLDTSKFCADTSNIDASFIVVLFANNFIFLLAVAPAVIDNPVGDSENVEKLILGLVVDRIVRLLVLTLEVSTNVVAVPTVITLITLKSVTVKCPLNDASPLLDI